MRIKLKPLNEQVVVVLGASSGIGRASALALAARGAKVVVAARSQKGLVSLVAQITAAGGQATYVLCDVADYAQVRQVASIAVQTYGRIDTWVNCAALSLFAHFEETTPEEYRRLMEVNYLGHVHGALAALPRLREGGGGSLIAISSVESIVSLPLHAAYSASKHAVEGAMDALRRDLMAEKAPISVTSIKPATINTPLFTNSRSRMDVKPKGPPPIYQPNVVADCVVYAAEHPVRDLFAGGSGRMMALQQFTAPRQMDLYMAKIATRQERTKEPKPDGMPGNLYEPTSDDRAAGDYSRRARRFSVYTYLETHPKARALAAGSALVTTALLLGRRNAAAGAPAVLVAPTQVGH
ncbi:MAG TPA: SDR family oxidoreductase [Propionibacteriaceae bacterium]|jgi:NAD(P)-dependent dehydrogenase (short-subunit alcohol dehydrogenase family)